jgi:hypothetical protein
MVGMGPEVSSDHIEAVLGMIDHVGRVVEPQSRGINHSANLLEDFNSDRSMAHEMIDQDVSGQD